MNRYRNYTRKLRNENPITLGTLGDKYYDTVSYPEVGASESDIYIESEFGDKLPALALSILWGCNFILDNSNKKS